MENQDKNNQVIQRKPEQNKIYKKIIKKLIECEQKLNPSHDDLNNTPILIKVEINFKQQKIFFFKVQGLLLLWTIIHFCCRNFFQKPIEGSFNYYCYSLAILLILKLSTVYIWIKDKYRKYSILTYFVSIGLYTRTFFYLYVLIEKSEVHVLFIKVPLMATQFYNFIIALMFIFYLILEKTEIRTTRFLVFVGTITLLIAVCYKKMILFLIFSIPYAILQTNNFKKIAQGKFQLKENQVFLGALVMNFQLYFPFNRIKE